MPSKQPSKKDTPAEEVAEPIAPAEPPKKKRGKLLLLLVTLLFVAAAGAGGFYFTQWDAQATPKPAPPVFVALDTFTVNLASVNGHPQFVQAGLTLKLTDPAAAALVKERMPEIRDRVLMVLSAKRGSDLLPVEGKQQLAVELSDAVRKVIAPAPTAAAATDSSPAAPVQSAAPAAPAPAIEVLFTAFIIQ